MIKYDVTVEDDGTQGWWVNGKQHREDGPAYIGAKGTTSWWINGKLHREDGPAIIFYNGTKSWCLDGVAVTEADVMGHKIKVDGKEVTLSAESYKNLKASLST